MKKVYLIPVASTVLFTHSDIITTSGDPEHRGNLGYGENGVADGLVSIS